jgi:hypothetical protein
MFHKQLVISILWSLGLFLTLVSAVGAVPPLPVTVYGRAQLNGADVAPGRLVVAWIDGMPAAQTVTTQSGGQSVYVLDIPGDESWDPETNPTPPVGAIITFTLAGIPAPQTTTWSAGDVQMVNLSINMSPSGARLYLPLLLH